MASLTSNPMEDTENMEDEYMEENSGHRRSRSNPGPEQTRPQPPRSLDFPSATSSISLTTPSSPGVVLGKNTKLENIKNWTISTYKCSRQSLYEKMGKTSKTVDPELEDQIETLRNTQKKYSDILRLARALTSHFFNLVQTQNSLGECFSDLAHKSPELQQEFLYNAEAQRNLTKNGQHLLASLNFFVSSVNTIANKTMEDSLLTVKQYETARVEYDAYRTDLEFYTAAKETEANQMKLSETQLSFNNKKAEFEKLRSDVQIKLKFLDENRVKVMAKQLLLFHTAVSAYFSGNQVALEESMKQFAGKVKTPATSWIEQ
eukprot:GFUD01127968.1.p1 GENE.GFUD01127968.1~~GFUD01127968.1.p1  ORF type:complete len:318 (+),score=111.08 GFUD01127968.1:115-1068(+)